MSNMMVRGTWEKNRVATYIWISTYW